MSDEYPDEDELVKRHIERRRKAGLGECEATDEELVDLRVAWDAFQAEEARG